MREVGRFPGEGVGMVLPVVLARSVGPGYQASGLGWVTSPQGGLLFESCGETHETIKEDILKDSGKSAQEVVVYGENSSMLSLVNNLKFKYKPVAESEYLVSFDKNISREKFWVLLNKYRFLDKSLYLYKKIND